MESISTCELYSFYNANCPIDTTKATSLHLPPDIAKLIDKANQHNPCLSFLGILPNRLRRVLKISRHPDPEAALTDISRTLFFSGFRVWLKRKALAAQYWKSAAAEYQQVNISGRKRKNYHMEEKMAQSNCKNPLHFMKRYANLSHQRPNRCPCSRIQYTAQGDIRDFVLRFPALSLEYVSNIVYHFDHIFPISTQSDDIRREHDRGKIRKQKRKLNL